jgi:serine/threonine protein kinase
MKQVSRNKILEFIIACTILGLEYMHKYGVIHRDVKPENLVIDEYGYVRLTDLGIAHILTEEHAKDCSGTLGYMAPEAIFKHNQGFAADYFSLGVIGYEAITGEVTQP